MIDKSIDIWACRDPQEGSELELHYPDPGESGLCGYSVSTLLVSFPRDSKYSGDAGSIHFGKLIEDMVGGLELGGKKRLRLSVPEE